MTTKESKTLATRIAVGTPVNVIDRTGTYLMRYGMKGKDLVVLTDQNPGYGIGPVGNDPKKAHNRDGWIYFSADEVTPKQDTPSTKESTKVSKFKAGDKVRVTAKVNGNTIKSWVGVEGIVEAPNSGSTNYPIYRVRLTDPKNTGHSVGYLANIGDNLELIQPSFKAGDTVEFVEDYMGDCKVGTRATVVSSNDAFTSVKVGEHGAQYSPFTRRLKLVTETPFTFADIQKGDTIRRTHTRKDGAKDVREGVALIKGSYYWATDEGNFILAYDDDSIKPGVVLELVNRPEPEPKITDGTKAGDQLLAVHDNGIKKLYTKLKKDSWTTTVIKADSAHIGFTWTDEAINREADRPSVTISLLK